jgi:hypothetical protein
MARRTVLQDLCVGDGELAQLMLSRLPLGALARLTLASSTWSAEAAKALVDPARWERYHVLLSEIMAMAGSEPSDDDAEPDGVQDRRAELLKRVEAINDSCVELHLPALDYLREGRDFEFPPPSGFGHGYGSSNGRPPRFYLKSGTSPYDSGTCVELGLATDVAYFVSRVLPSAMQAGVHAAFRAVAVRQDVPAFVKLIRQAALVINDPRYESIRKHKYSHPGFEIKAPKLIAEYYPGVECLLQAAFMQRNDDYPFIHFRLPLCMMFSWTLDEVVDAQLSMGFDAESVWKLSEAENGLPIVKALASSGRVFGVLDEAQLASLLYDIYDWEDDRVAEFAAHMRLLGRELFPPSLIARVATLYADRLYDNYSSHGRHYGGNVQDDVVDRLCDFFESLHFPSSFTAEERAPILSAIRQFDSEVLPGMRGAALGWVRACLGEEGGVSPANAINMARDICDALLS